MDKVKNINKILGTLVKRVPKIKNNKGISLISLIITIIVIIILASIVLMNFNQTSEKASISKILNEFIELENAVSILGKMHNMDPSVHQYYGTPLYKYRPMTINNKTYEDGYFLLNENQIVQLGVNGASREYIVNYDTGEVIATEPYIIEGRNVYTKAELINIETDNSVTGVAEYDKVKGVNKPILYHGMVPVKQDGGVWTVCDVDDNEWYDYSITTTGPTRYANAMLMDDIILNDPSTGKTLSNEQVRGSKISALVGCKVINDGSMFIWVPRYTYNETTHEIVFSNLTSDYLKNGFIRSPAFYNGEYQGANENNGNAGYIANGKELTGIWISKYQASYLDD